MTDMWRDMQARVFAQGEGDRWFERNRAALLAHDPASDPPMRAIAAQGLRPRSVLEIGAANGYRLAALQRRYGCRAVGVEASRAAVSDGRSRFPRVELHCGLAHEVPLDEVFDLVIVNFVLHWIDRGLLLRAISEIDRLVADGGFLLIGDFLPAHPTRTPYHHLPGAGVLTYKQDYAAIFVASAGYVTVALETGSHESRQPTARAADSERVGVWLLRKQVTHVSATIEGALAVPTRSENGAEGL